MFCVSIHTVPIHTQKLPESKHNLTETHQFTKKDNNGGRKKNKGTAKQPENSLVAV